MYCLGMQESSVHSDMMQGGLQGGPQGGPQGGLQGFLAGMSGGSAQPAQPAQPLPTNDLLGAPPYNATNDFQAGVAAGSYGARAEEVLIDSPASAPPATGLRTRPAVMTGLSGDQIDRTLQEWFAAHPDFQVDIDKVKPGWYMLGPPISAKHYMKMAGAQVVVRVGGGFKNLIKYLSEQRHAHVGAAEVEADAQAVRRRTQDARRKRPSSTSASSGRRSDPGTRPSTSRGASRGGSARPSARPSAR